MFEKEPIKDAVEAILADTKLHVDAMAPLRGMYLDMVTHIGKLGSQGLILGNFA